MNISQGTKITCLGFFVNFNKYKSLFQIVFLKISLFIFPQILTDLIPWLNNSKMPALPSSYYSFMFPLLALNLICVFYLRGFLSHLSFCEGDLNPENVMQMSAQPDHTVYQETNRARVH